MTDTTQATASAAKKPSRDRVAKHEYLDAEGNVVESEEAAEGYRYSMDGDDADNPLVFEWYWAEANPIEQRMVAIFGVKTLATNESSQLRNNLKYKTKAADGSWVYSDEASQENQMAAVKDRFAFMRKDPPQWMDRTREGPAVRIDKQALAEALCEVLVREGKKTQADIDQGHLSKVIQKFEDDPSFVKKARSVPAVQEAYAKRIGRATASLDDFDNI
jgi:hypothetical protein